MAMDNIPGWSKLWADLKDAPADTERAAFANFCLALLALADEGKIPKESCAFAIAEAYSLDRYDDSDQLEEIMHLALELEVPTNIITESWLKLRKLVDTLNSDSIFEQLDDPKTNNRREILHAHLIDRMKYQAAHPDESRDIAYGLAGLLATDFARGLPNDDPYVVILGLAGQLELPEAHHGDATWEEMRSLVDKL